MTRHRPLWPLLYLASLLLFAPALFAQTRSLKKVHVGVPAVSMGNIIIFLF